MSIHKRSSKRFPHGIRTALDFALDSSLPAAECAVVLQKRGRLLDKVTAAFSIGKGKQKYDANKCVVYGVKWARTIDLYDVNVTL